MTPREGRRTYADRCGIARALDQVGERWALLVIRELLLGPKRFTDVARGLPSVSPNVLSERLKDLERSGIVRRRRLGPPVSSVVYELTERGAELEPVLLALGRWGSGVPLQPDVGMSVDAAVVALKTMFDPATAAGLMGTLDLRLGGDRFRVDVAAVTFTIRRGDAERPDATLETDVATLLELTFGGGRVADAAASGALRLEGDGDWAQRLFDAFAKRGS